MVFSKQILSDLVKYFHYAPVYLRNIALENDN